MHCIREVSPKFEQLINSWKNFLDLHTQKQMPVFTVLNCILLQATPAASVLRFPKLHNPPVL